MHDVVSGSGVSDQDDIAATRASRRTINTVNNHIDLHTWFSVCLLLFSQSPDLVLQGLSPWICEFRE